jgi:hypothetical protein
MKSTFVFVFSSKAEVIFFGFFCQILQFCLEIVVLLFLLRSVGMEKDGGEKDVQSQNCSDHSKHLFFVLLCVKFVILSKK